MYTWVQYSAVLSRHLHTFGRKVLHYYTSLAHAYTHVHKMCHLRPDRFSGLCYFFSTSLSLPGSSSSCRTVSASIVVGNARGSARSAAHDDRLRGRNPLQRNWFPPDDYPSVDVRGLHHRALQDSAVFASFFSPLGIHPFSCANPLAIVPRVVSLAAAQINHRAQRPSRGKRFRETRMKICVDVTCKYGAIPFAGIAVMK